MNKALETDVAPLYQGDEFWVMGCTWKMQRGMGRKKVHSGPWRAVTVLARKSAMSSSVTMPGLCLRQISNWGLGCWYVNRQERQEGEGQRA